SHKTTRAGHRRIRRRNQHHPPPRPPGTLDQLPLRGTDRGISRLTRHSRTGKELGLEILHSDRVMIGDHAPRPHTSRVRVLPGGLLVDPCDVTPRTLVASTRCLPARTAATRHLPLRPSQFSRAPLPVPTIRQVISGIGGSRGSRYAPVDTDTTGRGGNAGV